MVDLPSSSSLIGVRLVELVTSDAVYGLQTVLFMAVRPPIMRLTVALVLAAPAVAAGHTLIHGTTREAGCHPKSDASSSV